MASDQKIPNSIKEYHSQSWQLEIIIAGGILFSLYSLGGDLRSFFLENESYSRTTSNQMLLFFGAYILSTVLLIGFSANLVLRGIWLAYLGLSFAFKEGINYDNIKGGAALKEKLRSEPTALDRVKKLEVWCKLSFSFAVLMGLFTLSLVVSMSIAIWLLNFISPGAGDIAVVTYSLLVLLGIVQLGLIDRLLITKKSNSFWSKIANGITSFLNILTISFLYRREALVLRTNVNRWLIYSFAFLYLGIAVVTSVSRVGQYYSYGTFTLNFFDDRENYDVISDNPMIYNEYDENLTPGDRITNATIQSEIIKDNYLKIFIESNQVFDSG